jgi:predicted flavoprotein YhiN
MQTFDAVVVGAGAAGLLCAALAGQRGVRVLLIDHAEKIAEKIRISGGGRCNFTNRDAGPANFLSANPHYCRSALARYTPQDFIALVQRHRIPFHEKHKGQLFCDGSSDEIITMLLRECAAGHVTRMAALRRARRAPRRGRLRAGHGPRRRAGGRGGRGHGGCRSRRSAPATSAIASPGATATASSRPSGARAAHLRPSAVGASMRRSPALSLPGGSRTGDRAARGEFVEDLLFTHRGLSGPAICRSRPTGAWHALSLDLAPTLDLAATLQQAKASSRRKLGNELAEFLPRRLAEAWLADRPDWAASPLPELPDRALRQLSSELQGWTLTPSGTEGYRKAEVTAGGVDTRELSSQTMESRRVPGLYFIGEVVDVTGWLGGYNFQWAWASAAACAQALPRARAC